MSISITLKVLIHFTKNVHTIECIFDLVLQFPVYEFFIIVLKCLVIQTSIKAQSGV